MREKTMWSRREFVTSGLAGVGLTATLPSVEEEEEEEEEGGKSVR